MRQSLRNGKTAFFAALCATFPVCALDKAETIGHDNR